MEVEGAETSVEVRVSRALGAEEDSAGEGDREADGCGVIRRSEIREGRVPPGGRSDGMTVAGRVAGI